MPLSFTTRFNGTNTKGAFTLVELLIVVGIIGLLATIGVSAYQSAARNSRNSQRKANLVQLQKALELYANDHGGIYPGGSYYGACTVYNAAGGNPRPDTGPTGWIPGLAPTYISVLPHDSLTNVAQNPGNDSSCQTAGYSCYVYNSNGVDYKLWARCLPEGTLSASDPFYDPTRPAYSWMVSTPGGRSW